MPSKSEKQRRLMAMICNGGEEARKKLKKKGMKDPPSVKTACEFHRQDRIKAKKKKGD